jgi:hypothetical protein
MSGPGFGRATRRENTSHNSNPNAFGGLWDAVVVDDRDPKKIGRVKIRIFDLHDENTPLEQLPWAMPNFPTAFINPEDTDKSGGMFHIPPVDALVNVMFRHSDPSFPVWIGGWFQSKPCISGREGYRDTTRRTVLYNEDNRPSCPSWRSLRGHSIELDDDIPEIRITTVSGHKITLGDGAGEHGNSIKLEDNKGNYIWMETDRDLLEIFWNGNVNQKFTGDLNTKVGGNYQLHVDGAATISDGSGMTWKSGGAIAVDGTTIDLNSGIAQEATPTEPSQGEKAAGSGITEVLARLGSIIKKIVTGG